MLERDQHPLVERDAAAGIESRPAVDGALDAEFGYGERRCVWTASHSSVSRVTLTRNEHLSDAGVE